jgi:hypothetical protein
MEQGLDFTIEPFIPRKHQPRSDRGKTHNYPKNRGKCLPVLGALELVLNNDHSNVPPPHRSNGQAT